MTIEAELPDGRVLEFPDGTTPDVVQATVKRVLGVKAAPQQTAGGMALEGMSGPEKFAAGAGKAVADMGRGIWQFLNMFNEEESAKATAAIDEAKTRDAPLMDTGAGLAGNIAGNIAATAIPGAAVQGAATRAAGAVLPAIVAPTVAAAGTGAAISAATEPVATGESRGEKAAYGAAGAAAGDLAARGLSRVAQPIRQSAPVKKLLSEGVVPTPGAAAGANSFVGRIEQQLMSLPIVGHIIRAGRERAAGELDVAAINRALPKDAKGQITSGGRAALAQADNILSNGYDTVLAKIKTVRPDMAFWRRVVDAGNDPDIALPPDMQQQFANIMRSQIIARANGKPLTGEVAKRVDSTLGTMIRNYSGSQDGDKRALGMALREAQASLRELLERSAPDQATADALKDLNRSYANFLRVERAASYTGAQEGKFSPAQLQQAVRAMDSSKNKRAFSQGRALMQDLSDPAVATMANTVPNSGTADRALAAMVLGGAGAGVNEYYGGPGALTALLAAPALYSRAGSRYAVGNLIPGQVTLAEILRRAAPYTAQAGRGVAGQLAE